MNRQALTLAHDIALCLSDILSYKVGRFKYLSVNNIPPFDANCAIRNKVVNFSHDPAKKGDIHARNSILRLYFYEQVIVPPSWIVKVPRKGSFKSSLKTSPNKKKKKGGKPEKIDEGDVNDEDAVVQVGHVHGLDRF